MSNVNIGTKMRTLDVGQKQAAYTGVIVHAGQNANGEEIVYSVGNDTGSVFEVTVPNGSYALAYALLDKLKLRGYRYQPFEADGAIADPSIEIGDNITANNVPSIVMGINTNHSRLMASTLKAPFDEEVNHEWKYEPRSERQFKRESAYTRSRLTITEGQISAEVIRATDAESTLRSSIEINADNISAEVSRATRVEGDKLNHTYNNSSFGWDLTPTAFILKSNNQEVFRANSSGITVKGNGEFTGKITATSGYIGNGASGFEIGNTYIRNGMTSRDDTTHNGVYIGTDGIALGSGAFKATSFGTISANNMTLTGTLNVGGMDITASTLRTGAQEAYDGYSGWNGTSTYVENNGGDWTSAYDWKYNNGDYCVGGAGWGYNFGSMDDVNNSYPINASSFRYQGTQLLPQTISFVDGNMNVRTFSGVLMYS